MTILRQLRRVSDNSQAKGYIDTAAGREERHSRMAKLRLYARYYGGDVYQHPAEWASGNGYATSVSPPEIYINYARFLTDRLASFSFDRAIGVKLRPNNDVVSENSETATERFLANFIHTSRFLSRLTPIAREALLFGDVLLKLQYTAGGTSPLTFAVIPAEEFDFEHSPRDLADIRFVREEFVYYDDAGARAIHREELHPDRVIYYRDEALSEPAAKRFLPTLLSNMLPERLPPLEMEHEASHPFGRIPAVHVRNRPRLGMKFGVSELADLTPLLDDVNWKMAQRSRNISRTMNAILKNINGRLVSDQLDDTQIVSVIGENAELEYLTNDSDLAPVQSHLSELKQALTDLTGVVMLSPDKLTSVGAMSGFALSIIYEPLLNAARAKRREIGRSVENFLELVLDAGVKLGLIPKEEMETARPCLIYAPDLQFTEQEKLTRLRRELLAAESGQIELDEH